MKVFRCEVCGHLEFQAIPEKCPVCEAKSDKFSQADNIFIESQKKSPEAEIKHIPDILIEKKCGLIPEQSCTDVHVRVGKTLHPMEEKHFIQFIDCYVDDKYVARYQLSPKVNPATAFHLKASVGKITIVENCNIHGYWKIDTNL